MLVLESTNQGRNAKSPLMLAGLSLGHGLIVVK